MKYNWIKNIILYGSDQAKPEFQCIASKPHWGIYFDGKLDEEVGMDYVFSDAEQLPTGISVFNLANRKFVLGYIWETEYGLKGLIVDPSDNTAKKEALAKYKEKPDGV